MKSHYDKVGAERGKGMFLRMKVSPNFREWLSNQILTGCPQEENSKYILENHDSLFAAISDNAATSLEEIRSALHTQMTQALAKISLTIYTSLVSKFPMLDVSRHGSHLLHKVCSTPQNWIPSSRNG